MDLKSIVTGDDTLLIEPPRAELGQLQLTNRLEMVRVDNDVLGVAAALRGIDPGLKLMFDKGQEIYVLYHVGVDGRGHVKDTLVGAYRELDQRIVNLVRRLDAQGRGHVDLNRELRKLEEEKDREHARETSEKFGPIAEQLRYALRKDLGATGSSVIVSGGRGVHRSRRERRRRKGR